MFPEIVVVGCGNPLFGDDGFGPAVIRYLHRYRFPSHVRVIDAGTGADCYVFSLLDPCVTREIIIIDCIDQGMAGGSVIEIPFSRLAEYRVSDASSGGISANILLLSQQYEGFLLGCQAGCMLYPYMKLGLSDAVRQAVPVVASRILELIGSSVHNIGADTVMIRDPDPFDEL